MRADAFAAAGATLPQSLCLQQGYYQRPIPAAAFAAGAAATVTVPVVRILGVGCLFIV